MYISANNSEKDVWLTAITMVLWLWRRHRLCPWLGQLMMMTMTGNMWPTRMRGQWNGLWSFSIAYCVKRLLRSFLSIHIPTAINSYCVLNADNTHWTYSNYYPSIIEVFARCFVCKISFNCNAMSGLIVLSIGKMKNGGCVSVFGRSDVFVPHRVRLLLCLWSFQSTSLQTDGVKRVFRPFAYLIIDTVLQRFSSISGNGPSSGGIFIDECL